METKGQGYFTGGGGTGGYTIILVLSPFAIGSVTSAFSGNTEVYDPRKEAAGKIVDLAQKQSAEGMPTDQAGATVVSCLQRAFVFSCAYLCAQENHHV